MAKLSPISLMSRKIHFPKSPHPHKHWAKSHFAFKIRVNSSYHQPRRDGWRENHARTPGSAPRPQPVTRLPSPFDTSSTHGHWPPRSSFCHLRRHTCLSPRRQACWTASTSSPAVSRSRAQSRQCRDAPGPRTGTRRQCASPHAQGSPRPARCFFGQPVTAVVAFGRDIANLRSRGRESARKDQRHSGSKTNCPHVTISMMQST